MRRNLSLFIITITFISCSHKGPGVSTYAGTGKMGAENGRADQASFSNLMGLTVDSSGNVFVADSRNNLIRKISADGMVTTVAGSGMAGNDDGPAPKASFNYPVAVACDPKGNLYVSDSQNNLIRKISIDGTVSSVAGALTPANRDHPEDTTRLDNPRGIVSDKKGNIYFADYGKDVIRKITTDGKVITIAGTFDRGAKDGKAREASFYLPAGVAFDNAGNLYITDCYNNMIRKMSVDGLVTTLAGKPAPQGKHNRGSKDGGGPAASFSHPCGLTVDGQGNLYVADAGNHKIRKITPDGTVSTFAGTGKRGFDNGEPLKAAFYSPYGVVADKAGNLYIADYQNNVVRKISSTDR